MVVEGLPDDLTQAMIDDLIAKRQNKLKEVGSDQQRCTHGSNKDTASRGETE